MRNTLGDLQNHLFEQLERLNDDDLKGDSLKEEINRSKAMTNIGGSIIDNGRLMLETQKFYYDEMGEDVVKVKMLEPR